MTRSTFLLLLAALALVVPRLGAQQNVGELFDQGPFYDAAGILRGHGDVPFYADMSYLAGSADSTRALLGIALSNSSFQFVKQAEGYHAEYQVEATAKGDKGSFHNTWREEVKASTFDETLLDRETIVFQSAFALLPGTYDLDLEVRDTQTGETSKAESKLEVPALEPGAGPALSAPVLLRFYDPSSSNPDRDQVLYPSHYFSTVPDSVPFFAEVYGAAGGEPLELVASFVPDRGGAAVSTTTFDVPELQNGVVRVYGQAPTGKMAPGVYKLDLVLQDAGGKTLAQSSVKISVSAVTQWVESHWKDALELISYEATKRERDRLEDTPANERLAAWNEFWRVRDPIPATPGNEAFENYFGRIAAANASFGTKLRSGWKSDRGRVYVAFGPPSDIIRQPLQPNAYPVEIWVYDSPGFQIIFEDRIGFGNYQIVNTGTFANELAAIQRRKERAIEQRREAEEQGKGGETGTPAATPPAPSPASPDSSSERTSG